MHELSRTQRIDHGVNKWRSVGSTGGAGWHCDDCTMPSVVRTRKIYSSAGMSTKRTIWRVRGVFLRFRCLLWSQVKLWRKLRQRRTTYIVERRGKDRSKNGIVRGGRMYRDLSVLKRDEGTVVECLATLSLYITKISGIVSYTQSLDMHSQTRCLYTRHWLRTWRMW